MSEVVDLQRKGLSFGLKTNEGLEIFRPALEGIFDLDRYFKFRVFRLQEEYKADTLDAGVLTMNSQPGPAIGLLKDGAYVAYVKQGTKDSMELTAYKEPSDIVISPSSLTSDDTYHPMYNIQKVEIRKDQSHEGLIRCSTLTWILF